MGLFKSKTYPIVCWLSTENRNACTKLWTFMTQGFQSSSPSCSKSPCAYAISHQSNANAIQLPKKPMAKTNRFHLHWMSTIVVKISCRYLWLRLDTFSRRMFTPPFFRITLFLWRFWINLAERNRYICLDSLAYPLRHMFLGTVEHFVSVPLELSTPVSVGVGESFSMSSLWSRPGKSCHTALLSGSMHFIVGSEEKAKWSSRIQCFINPE